MLINLLHIVSHCPRLRNGLSIAQICYYKIFCNGAFLDFLNFLISYMPVLSSYNGLLDVSIHS